MVGFIFGWCNGGVVVKYVIVAGYVYGVNSVRIGWVKFEWVGDGVGLLAG